MGPWGSVNGVRLPKRVRVIGAGCCEGREGRAINDERASFI